MRLVVSTILLHQADHVMKRVNMSIQIFDLIVDVLAVLVNRLEVSLEHLYNS